MSLTTDHLLAQQLDPGEQLLWSGQPSLGIRLRAQDAFLIPFSLLWCGFAIFWETAVFRSNAPIFFRIWGVPFVLAGLYIVFGRFLVDARNRARTHYGITNERILIISGAFTRQTKSLPLRTLSDISLTQRDDGSGTITFGAGTALNAFFPAGAWPGAGRYAPPAFDLIARAKEVYDIIRNVQKGTFAKS